MALTLDTPIDTNLSLWKRIAYMRTPIMHDSDLSSRLLVLPHGPQGVPPTPPSTSSGSSESINRQRPGLHRTPSMNSYVSPLLEKLTDTPFTTRQLGLTFKLDNANISGSTSSSSYGDGRPVQLASVSFARQSVRGTLHVRPDLPAVRVFVRYTTNGWGSYSDADACFIGKDGWFFSFSVGAGVRDGDAVSMCFCVQLRDGCYIWENNSSQNYNATLLSTHGARRASATSPPMCAKSSAAGVPGSRPQANQTTSVTSS